MAWIATVALCVAPFITRPEPAVAQSAAPDDTIVVSGVREIVVNGRARPCRPVPGDPLDDVRVGHDLGQMAIVPDGAGGYVLAPNAEQITGPDFWQRVGVGMAAYVFRGPSGDKPMCVGDDGGTGDFAGFRRIVDAAPYRGHRLRFTAWVATGRARQVSFWLAAGTPWRTKPPVLKGKTPLNRLLNGGNSNSVPFGGNHGWTPVLLEIGPLPDDADHVSYGFNLQGWGDVWVYHPKLEVVDPADSVRTGDVVVIGRDEN